MDEQHDGEFLTRVAAFIDATDVHLLREDWGDEMFGRVVDYAWAEIPCLVRRLTVLGDRRVAGPMPGKGA